MNRPNRHASLEQETKFYLPDAEILRERIAAQGFAPYQARMHEDNIRFDTPEGALTRQGKVLRLRKAGRCLLTFKQPEASNASGPARRHMESEVVVEDLERTAYILEGLGYIPIVRYEKHREVFSRDATLAMLDQLPFGDFLELEGPDLAEMRTMADRLGLQWGSALQASYMGIFLLLKRTYQLPFREATFANFQGWDRQKTAAVLAQLTHEALHDKQTL
jgi:adenylate cyclase class 2